MTNRALQFPAGHSTGIIINTSYQPHAPFAFREDCSISQREISSAVKNAGKAKRSKDSIETLDENTNDIQHLLAEIKDIA